MPESVEEILARARAGTRREVTAPRPAELLRRSFGYEAGAGGVYLSCCGDGSAAAAYPGRSIFGADPESRAIAEAKRRYPEGEWRAGNCDEWPWRIPLEAELVLGRTPRPRTIARTALQIPPFAIGEFDHPHYPYDSFRSWWAEAPRMERLVLLFADRQPGRVPKGEWREPDGTIRSSSSQAVQRTTSASWLTAVCRPWMEGFAKREGWRICRLSGFPSGGALHWGAVLQKA